MSSASKRFRRAGVGGVSALVAVTSFLATAGAAHADWAPAGGQIGIVDTDTSADNGTQGATLVYSGANGQMLGDVQLLIPNTFKNGDTIDLAIFDRTATATSTGQINADAAHKLGFSSTPSVVVGSKPYLTAATVGPTSGTATDVNNSNANGALFDTTTGKATTAPVFTPSVVASSRANGLATDIVRLKISGVQAAGAPGDKWLVTVKGLKADLGSSVSPGELRVVPFAYNGQPGNSLTNVSPLFGNTPDDPATTGFDPTIDTYTVPAYVSPVNFTVGTPTNVVADNTPQNVGDITISETNGYSLQNGTYTVHVAGANVANSTSGQDVTVKLTNKVTGEDVTSPATISGNDVSFTLSGMSDTNKVTVTLSGLQLKASSQGKIRYSLSGGSIDEFMASPAGTSPAFGPEPADTEFSAGVNQTDIESPGLPVATGLATPLLNRLAGADRYQTAAKVALSKASHASTIVLASGENYADALSSSYLATSMDAATLLTTKDSLPEATRDALRQLTYDYSGQYSNNDVTVFVIGSTGAISNNVVNELRNNVYGHLNVIRLGGTDRYETNKVVNTYAFRENGVGRTVPTFGKAGKYTALVASGQNFADALSAAPATAGAGDLGALPLILTTGSSLSPAAAVQMDTFNIERAVIVGGTGAVSGSTESAIQGHGATTERLAGANRFATATKVADWEKGRVLPDATHAGGGLGFAGSEVYLADGMNFPDALAAGSLAGRMGDPVILAQPNDLTSDSRSWLKANASDYNMVIGLGGAAAIGTAVLQEANNIIAAG